MTKLHDLILVTLAHAVMAPALVVIALILTPLVVIGAFLPANGGRQA